MNRGKVYHFTKSIDYKAKYLRLKKALIVLNVFIGVLFIVILIVFFTLNTTKVTTCEDDPDLNLQTPQEIIGIIYKVMFAALCIVLSILFAIYGARLVQLSNSLETLSLNEADRSDIQKSKKALIQVTILIYININST